MIAYASNMVMKNIKFIKNIQYSLYLFSIILLILSVVFIEEGTIKYVLLPYQNLFHYFIFNFQRFSWRIDSVSMYVVLQTECLFIFFGIALYIGLKIFPTPLSKEEKKRIVISPFNAFNEIIFKKILFGSVVLMLDSKFDVRSWKFSHFSDLYLFHFKFSNKKNILALIFVIVLIFPFLLGVEYKSTISLLVMNFVYINLFFLFFLELTLFIYGNYIRSKNHGWI